MNSNLYSTNNIAEQSEFKKNFNSLRSKWYWFPISFILAILIAKAFNDFKTPTYKVSCKIVIGDNMNEPLSTAEIIGAGNGIDFNRMNPINKEIGIIKSRNMAEETIDSLNLNYQCYELHKGGRYFNKRLYNDIPFSIVTSTGNSFETGKEFFIEILDPDKIKVTLNGEADVTKIIKSGDIFNHRNFSFAIKLNEGASNFSNSIGKRYVVTFRNKYSLASEYSYKLNVQNDPKSQNILTLSLIDENINQSIAYLNKLCELYIGNDIQIRNVMASKTIEYIDLQLGILTKQLNDAEDSLINFNKKYNVIISGENSLLVQNYQVITSKIEESIIDEQLLDLYIKTVDSVKSGTNNVLPAISSFNGKTGSILENINRLIIQQEILLINQSANSPEVKLNKQELDVNINKLKEFLALEKRMLLSKREDLINQQQNIENDLSNLPEIQRKKISFERKFKLTENLYSIYQQKRIEAILAKESTVSKIRVLDPPRFEGHQMVSPRKKYNYRISIVLSLFLPSLLIIVLKNLSNKVEDINEIKLKSKTMILGRIIHAELSNELPTVNSQTSPIAETFNKLYARLKYLKPDPGIKVISVTSGASGDGKTFCTANLAAAIALSGKKVVLLNLDLRKPKTHKIFNIELSPGLTNFLLNKTTKDEIIHSTNIENLDMIPSGPIPPDPIKLINQKILPELLSELSLVYDYVLIDTPPIGIVADAMLLGKYLDLQLFLIRVKFSKKSTFELLNEIEESGNFKNLAVVANDIKSQYGYNNRHYYNYYYTHKKKANLWPRFKKQKVS